MFMETKNQKYKTLFSILAVVIFFFGCYWLAIRAGEQGFFSHFMKSGENSLLGNGDRRVRESNDAFDSSMLRNSPTSLQNLVIHDLQNGINDKVTKSALYFITHRYFDNGGNIYEIYDYIESHPELAFLKEAEKIYPKWFEQIKRKELPPSFVERTLYVYLAYVEVLEKHGYTDVAALSTAANQYVKTAYFTTTIAQEMSKKAGAKRSARAPQDIEKAKVFLAAAQKDVSDILDGKLTEEDVTPRDILVGLNQYAAALRYFKALGINVSSLKNDKEIFLYATEYAHRQVPQLVHFTALLNASTLALLDDSDPKEIKQALYPILEFDTNGSFLPNSILHKVIDSRFEPKPDDVGSTNQDIYSKRNTLRLASKVPEFQTWLMANGWTEADFQQ